MTKKKNLVWLDINASYSHSSLALPAIEAACAPSDYTWKKVSGTINSDIFLVTKELHKADPQIIAATLWLFNHEIVIKICQRIKALLPEVKIILGGPEFNGDNEHFLRQNNCIDQVFRGEGEIEFQKILNHQDPKTIKGLCYIDPDGKYQDNQKASVADFKSLPAPEKSPFFDFDSPFVQLECSRGCFNSCAFCVSGNDKPIRTKPISEIRERLNEIEKKGIQEIRILDRTFNYSPKRAKEMLDLFGEYPQMNFHLEIHPALLTDELCNRLKAMPKGRLHLEAGMQSLDDKVIEASERIGTNQKAIEGLTKLCQMDNFETHADLIAGLPHYTLEQIFKDIRTLSKIKAAEIQLELLKLLPGTKMRDQAKELGICYAITPPYEVLQTPQITIDELDKARVLSKLVDKFYNAKGWQRVTRKIINENEDFLLKFLEYLIPTELLEKPISLEKRGAILHKFCKEKMQGNYLDEIAIAWIENGLSMRRIEAGDIQKATALPENITRQPNVHYFHWRGTKKQYIFCVDRSKDHSKPTERIEIK
ncbi:MAG: DUF4080 domain-containing protein [Rikenellaceae bacterium]